MASSTNCSSAIGKTEVKKLLGLARSDRERELIRYSVCKSSGVSSTAARKLYGFEKMQERVERIQEALKEAQCIREAVDDLSRTQEKALPLAMGNEIPYSDSESEASSDLESDSSVSSNGETEPSYFQLENLPLSDLGKLCKWNFFEIVKDIEDKLESAGLQVP